MRAESSLSAVSHLSQLAAKKSPPQFRSNLQIGFSFEIAVCKMLENSGAITTTASTLDATVHQLYGNSDASR